MRLLTKGKLLLKVFKVYHYNSRSWDYNHCYSSRSPGEGNLEGNEESALDVKDIPLAKDTL